ncbi:FAD-binding domain-containing protein 65 [Elsinoe fawcettii]|nr:FAD-binding domain-containing protein 65 [Elsinoe fawcettii]
MFIEIAVLGLATVVTLIKAAPANEGCDVLVTHFPEKTFFPNSTRYTFENEYSWTSTTYLGPSCIFAPQSTEDVQFALRTFQDKKIKFAIRSGGAMPIDNAANIGPEGIQMAMTNLSTMAISEDRKSVVLGSGITWPPLYAYLDQYGVSANGIRSGDGGVIGAILGGGPFGFMSYEFGMANTAKSLECVLADGSVVTAAPEGKHADLFWALVGGGNNYCVVTQAVLNTVPVSAALIGTVSWGANVTDTYIKSVEQFALYGHKHPKASFEGQTRWVPSRSNDISFDGYLWYSGEGDVPIGLENFTAPILPVKRGNITRTTIGQWSNAFNYAPPLGTRAMFHWLTSKPSAKAARLAFDIYYETIAQLRDIQGFSTAFSMLPITSIVTRAPKNAMGLGRDDSPSIWYVESPLWSNPADDERVIAVHAEANRKIREALRAANYGPLDFMYLSDIEKSQIPDTFPAYGARNLRRLKQIRDKYDPNRVFTDLVPGGAKVALA